MSERETRDFMSVEAFSQLPFIRPTPTKEKKNLSSSSSTSTPIRLFGIEVDNNREEDSSSSTCSKENTTTTGTNDGKSSNTNGVTPITAGDNSRKFECHYCCRNFPTSQALGGHQNAHKRERQHAKRAHLQTALAAAAHLHHNPSSIGEGPHMYGLVNYHRLGPLSSSPRLAIGQAFDSMAPLPHNPPWSNDITGMVGQGNYSPARFYCGPGSISQPINGSPLPGLWRVSPMQGRDTQFQLHRDQSIQLPVFGGGGVAGGGPGGILTGTSLSSSLSPSSQTVSLYEPKSTGVKDQLSLDLHL